jgi:starch phosphorylase
MKVLVNGGLNCSELDGWWAEAYSPETGWALGDGQEHGEDPGRDAKEADQLYGLLEREIVPGFYDRNDAGMPVQWIQRMRESMANLTPQFSANRAVREYAEQYYLPLAEAFRGRLANNGEAGAGVLEWRRRIEEHWSRLRFGTLTISTDGGDHVFTVQAWLDELDPDAVAVELYADGKDGAAPVCLPMARGPALVGSEGGYTWTARVAVERRAEDFTPRLVPRHAAARVPLECTKILWYR